MAALAYVLDTPAERWSDPTLTPDKRLVELAAEMARRAPAARRPGLDDDEITRWEDYAGEVVLPMLDIQAEGIDGLRAKAAAVVWACGDEATFRAIDPIDACTTYNRLVHSIVSDLIAPDADRKIAAPEGPTPASEMARAVGVWLAEQQAQDAAWDRCMAAVDAATALHPQPPEILRDQVTNAVQLDRDHYARLDGRARIARAIPMDAGPRVAAFDEWAAAREAIDAAHHVQTLEAEIEQRGNTAQAAAHHFASIAPVTLKEAVVKYAALLAAFGTPGVNPGHDPSPDIYDAGPFFAFLKDIERLAP